MTRNQTPHPHTPDPKIIPEITQNQLDHVKKLLNEHSDVPVLPAGTRNHCQVCGQETMVTTNSLVYKAATPIGLVIVPRLPGAECSTCGAVAFDLSAYAIIKENMANEIVADYLTSVSKSGGLPAILIKDDLRRVLELDGREKMTWKVIDKNHAYVVIQRQMSTAA